MIVFTITNSRTGTVYVGTTKDSVDERWELYQLAKDLPIDAPLYEDIRAHGVLCFKIEEYDLAQNRQELAELFSEAMEQFDGVSLKGMKTSMPRTAVYPTSEGAVPKVKAVAKTKAELAVASAEKKVSASTSSVKKKVLKVAPSPGRAMGVSRSNAAVVDDIDDSQATLKLSKGRTGSALKEKRIKEAIALEKETRMALKRKQIEEQADEMKSILSNLDSRGSTLSSRF